MVLEVRIVVTPGEELCLEGNTRGFLGAGNVVS